MISINLIQKESKTLKFTVKDANGSLIDLTGATFAFYIKQNMTSAATKTKSNDSFITTQLSNGIVKLPLSASDLNLTGTYLGLLKTTLSTDNIDKFYFEIVLSPSSE